MELPTPLEAFAGGVWLKREDVHELGAFKWRGAAAVLEARRPDAVVTASTGNHGAATAWAARRAGIPAVVFVPEAASATKVGLIEANGAEIRRVGADMDEAKDAARAYAAEAGRFFFEDGAEPAQFDGYGAIAAEILDALPDPAAVVVPVGNGALLIGIGRVLRDRSPRTLRVGVVPEEAPAMADSWEAGQAVDSERCATFADGLAVRVAIPLAVEELATIAQRMLRVSERELAEAVAEFARAGIRVEGAAAASLAGFRRLEPIEGPIVLIVTGRNIDDALYEQVLVTAGA